MTAYPTTIFGCGIIAVMRPPGYSPVRTRWLLLLGMLAGLVGLAAADQPAPSSRAAELIAEVNALRAANGLDPYVVDPILMAVAQAQNDWRISAGVTTHSGPDGSRPRDRAIAAGYGAGSTVFISENIVDGSGLTPAEAVQWWTSDAPHLNTMLGENYRDVGAGAGESGGVWRYTLMAGYVAGGLSAGSADSSVGSGSVGAGGGPAFIVGTSTPAGDGSVTHIVEAGQTMWTIAAIYGVDLNELLALNGFNTTPILQVGDQILVQPAHTATPTEAPSATGTPSPRPSATLTPAPTDPPATETAEPAFELSVPDLGGTPLSTALMVAGGLLLVIGVVAALRSRG